MIRAIPSPTQPTWATNDPQDPINRVILNKASSMHFLDRSFEVTALALQKYNQQQQTAAQQTSRIARVTQDRRVTEILEKRKPADARLKDLPKYVENISSDDARTQLNSCRYFRQLLSIERNPPIQHVIDSGVVPRMVSFLQCVNNPPLQFEACWALTNIASGTSDHTQAVISAGAVPLFIALLTSDDANVAEQAVWAIGNVAGDSVQYRDYILECGTVTPLVNAIDRVGNISMIRNAVWTMSNLCRGKPQPAFHHVEPLIAPLSRLLYSTDTEVLTDCAWAFSYLSDGPNDRIQCVLNAGVGRRLVELCQSHPSFSVQTPALRVIGNIVTGDDIQTQTMLNLGVLGALSQMMTSTKKGIRKEAIWAISNITAGTSFQIQQVIDSGVVPLLIERLANDEWEIKKEATWAITNATSGGKKEQIEYLVQQGCIPPLCQVLNGHDHTVVGTALEGLSNILKVVPEAPALIESADGLTLIEQLQNHQSDAIYQSASHILETYFDGEDIAGDPANEMTPFPSGNFNF